MDTTKAERHSALPTTDDGTRVAYAEAATAARAAAAALEDALRDPDLRPNALLGPEVERYGEVRRRAWSARGVTAPRARRVLAYASAQYLGGYSKVEAGTRWTRSSGDAPHLPLVRQTCYALGLDPRKGSNRSTVGAVYGYLDALGILSYRPGVAKCYASLAYGPVALTGRSLAQPPHRVSGGIPQHYGRGSTPALGDTSREGLREERTLPTPRSEPVAQSAARSERETSTTSKSKSNTSGVRLTRAGALLLDALYEQLGKYGSRYPRRLDEQGYRDHGALIAQANTYGAYAEREGGYGHGSLVRALDLGRRDNLDKAESLPSTLAAIMRERYAEVTTPAPAARYYYTAGDEEPTARWAEEPATLRADEEPATMGAALTAALAGLIPEERETEVAFYALAAGSAVAEMRPAYEADEPLRGRLILDAVQQAGHLGYSIPEEDAVALHAHYLDLRQAGRLDPATDLAEVQEGLGRPLHLAEVALYGVTLRVPGAELERAETSTYTGGAAYPEPIQVREVSLAGTAVTG